MELLTILDLEDFGGLITPKFAACGRPLDTASCPCVFEYLN